MNKQQWNRIKHFTPNEFVCRCGCVQGPEHMAVDFIHRLDRARDIAGIPFIVTSAYRCPEHNAEVGGVSSSAHTKGHAVDIDCGGSRSRAIIIKSAIEAGFNRIGIGRNFIHLDDDPDKPTMVFWVY